MGTRCNIRVVDEDGDELWFYRHYDGYPSSVLPSLEPLMERLKNGEVRDNVGQFSGWIVVLGHDSYRRGPYGKSNNWKVGHYEPTTGQHGDIVYLYTIDLGTKTLTYKEMI